MKSEAVSWGVLIIIASIVIGAFSYVDWTDKRYLTRKDARTEYLKKDSAQSQYHNQVDAIDFKNHVDILHERLSYVEYMQKKMGYFFGDYLLAETDQSIDELQQEKMLNSGKWTSHNQQSLNRMKKRQKELAAILGVLDKHENGSSLK